MRYLFLVSVLGMAMIGCTQKPGAIPDSTAPSSPSADATHTGSPGASHAAGGGGESGTITPLGTNVGPITPVAGGENLDGGTGGGLAQAAKGKAKEAAAQSTADANSAASGSD